jgi:hypothetical protein
MTALLIVRSVGATARWCGADCYDAKHEACTCVCAGACHGIGRDQAAAKARELAGRWIDAARARGERIDEWELTPAAYTPPLFPLEMT